MMNIDLYGSRYTLIPLMRNTEKFNFEVNKAYLGSALTSQYAKTQRVDLKQVEKRLNEYEQLEVLNDRLKLFRRFSSQTKSNTLIIDFLYEGYEILSSNDGRLTSSLSNQKYDKKILDNKVVNKYSRSNLVESNIDIFLKDLEKFDIVILNKLRLPKYKMTSSGTPLLNDDIQNINIMNAFIETFEDLLINKLENLLIIPLYEHHQMEGYWFTQEYLDHFRKYLNILDFQVN